MQNNANVGSNISYVNYFIDNHVKKPCSESGITRVDDPNAEVS